ncbi:MAG TPA: hypothetical protein VI072_12925 [Polyangiaceae bacterium]
MRKIALGLALLLAGACNKPRAPEATPAAQIDVRSAAVLREYSAGILKQYLETNERCRVELARVAEKPPLPGTAALDSTRAELLARAKAEPVLFWRAPRRTEDLTPEVALFRDELARARPPHPVLGRLRKAARDRRELARQVLLTEGYFYAEDPELAIALVEHTELDHLFDVPEIEIQRGAETLHAVRGEKDKYVYTTGPLAGKRASLILFDRVRSATDPHQRELHFDVRSLADKLSFERLRIVRATEGELSVELRYGELWVSTLLRTQGAELEKVCEVLPREIEHRVSEARDLSRRHAAVMRLKRRAMLEQIEESLPFDEPKTEDGQQDGNLRPAWLFAYKSGWDSYKFNEDRYPVFDSRGRPRLPQVCVDFITDTLERASGTWFRERGLARERVKGQLDFNELALDNRRSVGNFVEFAEAHPAWFDVYRLDQEERVRFGRRKQFFAHLSEHADRYMTGDIIVIHGLKDDNEYHWHSFYVFDADPVTGMPTLVAANAGRPRIRTWDAEMRNAPKRSIRMRVRPRLEWLEAVLPVGTQLSHSAPLPVGTSTG